jgi:hypothetical protein
MRGPRSFWSPTSPSAVRPTTLHDEEPANLSLVGEFENAPNREDSQFRILGWRGNDRLTLNRCFSYGPNVRAPGITESRYYANEMFVGHHFERGELAFQSAVIRLTDLDSWIGISGIVTETDYQHVEPGSHPIYRMAFTPPTEEAYPFSRGRVKLGFGWKPGGDPIHGISFQQWPGIILEYDQMQGFDTVQRDVNRIQALVTLCLDAPTAIDSLVLRRPDIQAKVLSGEDAGVPQPIEFIATPIRYVDPQDRQPRHWHQMLLGFEEPGGIEAIARWLDASERYQRAPEFLHKHKACEADVCREPLPERHFRCRSIPSNHSGWFIHG